MEAYRKLNTDLLIIGSEAGGAMAAFHAARSGLHVTMVTKTTMGRGGVTVLAPYSCNAALGLADPRDNPEAHYRDTIAGGRYINDRKLARIMAEESPARVLELASWGLRWTKEGGKIRQGWMPGHTYPRALHVGLYTGLRMVQVFRAHARKFPNINVMNDIFITRLMTDGNGEVAGAVGIDLDTGEAIVFVAKATIIATGGGMYLYRYNSAAPESTGDGYAYAYQVGAQLIDMEFVQFFPTGGLYPRPLQGKMGPGIQRYYLNAYLYNSEGERFMSRYDPVNMEKATRDILSRAIFMEIKAGRASPHGGVWLDCSYLPRNIIEAQLEKFFGGSWRWIGIDMLEYGLDIREKAVEVIPVAHYFMGGDKDR